MELAPVVLFCYNRLSLLQQTVTCLQQNPLAADSTLIVFVDGPKSTNDDLPKVQAVRDFVKQITGFKHLIIHESTTNSGLAKSVISGVSQVFESYDKAIVMEDDLLCSSDFLLFMNQALTRYTNDPLICSVTGYIYPFPIPTSYTKDVLLIPRGSSWGWGTWKDRWQQTDWEVQDFANFLESPDQKREFTKAGPDLLPMLIKQRRGLIQSWAVRWTYHHYKTGTYCLHPTKSKITHIGYDGSGTNEHSLRGGEIYETAVVFPDTILPDQAVIRNVYRYFSPSLYRRVINWHRYNINPFTLV
jgi:hypothetical protein